MKKSLGSFLGMVLVAITLTACGSNNTAAQQAAAAAAQQAALANQYGTANLATGAVGFTLNSPYMSLTTAMGGIVPNYGQIGQAYVTGTTGMNQTGSNIQYQQKSGGYNGQIVLYGSTQALTGAIQLSQSALQDLYAIYGQNMQITNIGVWVVQNLTSSYSGYYSGYIAQVTVYLYINGSSQPVPLVF